MNTEVNEITINGVDYIRKGEENKPEEKVDGMDYVIVRTYSAGCFAGYLKRREGKEIELVKARRIWFWAGAASLSQLAIDGTSKPKECKFPTEVNITLTESIEIINTTEKAKKSIQSVPVWQV